MRMPVSMLAAGDHPALFPATLTVDRNAGMFLQTLDRKASL
jgi:hypothetical protein